MTTGRKEKNQIKDGEKVERQRKSEREKEKNQIERAFHTSTVGYRAYMDVRHVLFADWKLNLDGLSGGGKQGLIRQEIQPLPTFTGKVWRIRDVDELKR